MTKSELIEANNYFKKNVCIWNGLSDACKKLRLKKEIFNKFDITDSDIIYPGLAVELFYQFLLKKYGNSIDKA